MRNGNMAMDYEVDVDDLCVPEMMSPKVHGWRFTPISCCLGGCTIIPVRNIKRDALG